MHTMTIAQRQKKLAKLDKLKGKPLSALEGDGQWVAIWAHRYSLAFRSDAGPKMAAYLELHWNELLPRTQQVILLTTIDALMTEITAGDDHAAWKAFASTHFADLSDEEKQTIKSALAWKDKPWPLEDKR